MRLTRRTLLKAGASAVAFPTIISRASAQDVKQLHVGVYNSALGRLIQKGVIPKFEAEYKCRIFTTEGATLSNIAALRATRDTPRFSVMMMDDVGIPQAKQEGLIDKLDAAKIPNLEKVYKRLRNASKTGPLQGALIVIDPGTGAVRSLGGVARIRLRRNQPGSAREIW